MTEAAYCFFQDSLPIVDAWVSVRLPEKDKIRETLDFELIIQRTAVKQ